MSFRLFSSKIPNVDGVCVFLQETAEQTASPRTLWLSADQTKILPQYRLFPHVWRAETALQSFSVEMDNTCVSGLF